MNVDQTLAELKTQHASLTEAYQKAKVEGTRADHASARDALAKFRAKYGKVITALDEASTNGATEV
jgi:hypothetical protein